MQLFTRRVHTIGAPNDVRAYATDMRAFVADKTGRDIGLWSTVFGAPVGTFFYTVRVEGVADLMTMTSSLTSDAQYNQKAAAGREFIAAPAEDSLSTPVFGELGDAPPVGSFAQVVSAVIANGQYEAALSWGAEIAAYVQGLTGIPEMFLAGQFGAFGNVTWIGGAPDAATVDQANATMNADAEYVKRLGDAKELFIPGSGMQGLVTRIA